MEQGMQKGVVQKESGRWAPSAWRGFRNAMTGTRSPKVADYQTGGLYYNLL